MKRKNLLSFVFSLAMIGILAGADASAARGRSDNPPLDPPYPRFKRPLNLTGRSNMDRARRSDTEGMIARLSPVKAQGSRGTCSIFSTIALIEALAIRKGAPTTIDLSEEWLQYLVKRENSYSEGSNSATNLRAVVEHGVVSEQTMPYVGQSWKDLNVFPAQQRCGKVPAAMRPACLLGHRDPRLLMASEAELIRKGGMFFDPEFLAARREAAQSKATLLARSSGPQMLSTSDQIKQSLQAGIPVIVGMDFYYGSWNHRKSEELGIPRNLLQWEQGVITYPEPGSLDEENSSQAAAGHSVLVVGYDDDVMITNDVRMADGRVEKKTYRGVFYIKNSWGTDGFGAKFQINGRPYPGYGMITQQYAMEHGSYFRLMVQ